MHEQPASGEIVITENASVDIAALNALYRLIGCGPG